MENYLVYKHTCPDGKSYIGITSNAAFFYLIQQKRQLTLDMVFKGGL